MWDQTEAGDVTYLLNLSGKKSALVHGPERGFTHKRRMKEGNMKGGPPGLQRSRIAEKGVRSQVVFCARVRTGLEIWGAGIFRERERSIAMVPGPDTTERILEGQDLSYCSRQRDSI